jgi:hypothetical protein
MSDQTETKEVKHECPCMSLGSRSNGTYRRSTQSEEGKYWAGVLDDGEREYTDVEAFTLKRLGMDGKYGCLTFEHHFPGCDEVFLHTEHDLPKIERKNVPIQYEGEKYHPLFGVGKMFGRR